MNSKYYDNLMLTSSFFCLNYQKFKNDFVVNLAA